MNIFASHYLKRDGLIYKELSELDHQHRIEYLWGLYVQAIRFRNSKQSKRFFIRLIKFCNRLKERA
jgi:hypothetical protein